MIRHLKHEEIDKAAWDARLERCSDRWWYGRSWVLDAASPGWEALVDEENAAQMALPWRRRLGVSYLYQPFLLQRIGVFGGAPQAFLQAVPKRFRYADVYISAEGTPPAEKHLRLTEQQNFELDLDRPLDKVRASYSENLRRNLKKPGDEGLIHERNADVEELITFLKTSEQFKRWGIEQRRIACMERIFRGAMERGEGTARAVRWKGTMVAGAFFVEWGGRLIFLKGLADAQGRELQAMHRLIDTVIADHVGRPLVLDFAGSNDADLARFYKGFGARRTVYLRAVINRLPPLVRNLKS